MHNESGSKRNECNRLLCFRVHFNQTVKQIWLYANCEEDILIRQTAILWQRFLRLYVKNGGRKDGEKSTGLFQRNPQDHP